MKTVYTGQGEAFIVSDEDYIWALGFNWFLTAGYPSRSVRVGDKWITTYLHHDIAKHIGLIGEVDHEDRNKLNGQRSNLREATHTQNMQNCKVRENSSTGVTGVIWHKGAQKYMIRITVNRKDIYLGLRASLKEATEIRRQAEIKYFGEFAPK